MNLPSDTLDALCPMHMHIGADGGVRRMGPTLRKLMEGAAGEGAQFAEMMDVFRPRRVGTVPDLLALSGRRLQLRLCRGSQMVLKGLAMPDGQGGVIVNMSFGIAVVDAVREHALTSTDFAVTDLAIDMLYLVEAKSAAFEASRTLNRRLQGAMLAAEQRAYTDTLTGLRNRRALDHVLQRLLLEGGNFALLHIDLDYFKQVNDTHGHAAGDRVLQAVARVMLELTRKDDTVARIGGDEFVILLVGLTDRVRLSALAEQLIHRIERPIPVEDVECRVSASIGIAFGAPKSGVRPGAEELMERADSALYRAKRQGRAQHAFDEPTPVEGLR